MPAPVGEAKQTPETNAAGREQSRVGKRRTGTLLHAVGKNRAYDSQPGKYGQFDYWVWCGAVR
jgi:hypothetical protein